MLAMRPFALLPLFLLAACAHAQASDPRAEATAACLGIAARNGVAIGGAPAQDTVVMGPDYVLGGKTWPATSARGEVLCTLHDDEVQSVTVGGKDVWRRR